MLNIVHINYSDVPQWEQSTMWTLIKEQRREGHNVQLFVYHKTTADDQVIALPKVPPVWAEAAMRQQQEAGIADLYSPACMGILEHPAFLAADVVHLHDISGQYFSYLLLPFLASKQVVWSMYPPYPHWGGCFHGEVCSQWETENCSHCPLDKGLDTKPKRSLLQQLKEKILSTTALELVAPSLAIKQQAETGVFKGKNITAIPYGIDTRQFTPGNKQAARTQLKLPLDKRILLFSAPGGLRNHLYGGHIIKAVLESLSKEGKANLLLLCLGGTQEEQIEGVTVVHRPLPMMTEGALWAAYATAADVYAAASPLSIPGNSLLQAMACGTPTVAFDNGDTRSCIVHQESGYLVKERSVKAYGQGLFWMLNRPEWCRQAGVKGAATVARSFSQATMLEAYRKLYQRLTGDVSQGSATAAPMQEVQKQTLASRMEILLKNSGIRQLVLEKRAQGWKAVWQEFDKRVKGYGEDKASDRAIFVDLYLVQCLLLEEEGSTEWFIGVEKWLSHRKMPVRCGGLPEKEQMPILYFCQVLRDKLNQYFSTTPLEIMAKLSEKQQMMFVTLWRQVFLNAFSPLNLQLDKPEGEANLGEQLLADKERQHWYPNLVIASMYAPFSADNIPLSATKLWNGAGIPIWCKAVLAFWLVSTPYFNSQERHRLKILRYVEEFCQAAMENPRFMSPGFFRGFMEEAMSGFWRASYVGGNNVKALSTFGDFIHFYMQRFYPQFKGLSFKRKKKANDKIRVGYISRNFCSQAVSYYMVNRILYHDRSQFEIHTFAIGERNDHMTELFVKNSDSFTRFAKLDDLAGVAKAVVDRKLDLLIYADIGMDPFTYMLAGLQLAPVQAALVGHGTTTGLPTVQYYISGDFESLEAQQHYREKLIRLPNSGAAQFSPGEPTEPILRSSLSIPEDAVVFISCANGIKHGPARDFMLIEILKQAPNAWIVLKPFQNPPSIHQRFASRVMSEARKAGVADRLRILPPLPSAKDIMGLLAMGDVQLDTYPYGGWTTNMEALYMGLPIVTQEGDMMRNRWGSHMLRALGIQEGIARDEFEYIAWAVRLAKHPEIRAKVRGQIQERVEKVLFNGKEAQAAYEEALKEIITEQKR